MGGVYLITTAEILGHADIKMTMRYAHPTPENKRKAVNVLASVFEKEKIVSKSEYYNTHHENLISSLKDN